MGKKITIQRKLASHQCRSAPYPLHSDHSNHQETLEQKVEPTNKCSESSKEDWHDATCSVCLEYPHNGILVLCSSHNKGCRPYMCATGNRYSNCFARYRECCTKLTELSCPLCRGQVRSWTVIEPARQFLNGKKRSCMHGECSFVGSYKELRLHTRAKHPLVRTQEVDPKHQQKWRKMEQERERADVICTIRSSMPGTVIIGDYVVDGNPGYASQFS